MKGHIMIYLGMYEDKPYAIHNFWSWREEGDDVHDNVFRVARVDVSDYTLGEGSGRSNFLDRLTHITLLGNYAFK
jgi:hypothetical protein